MPTVYRLLLLSILHIPAIAAETDERSSAAPENKARIYRSPDERRESGLGRQITDWLRISGLVEAEVNHARNHFSGGKDMTDGERPSLAFQLGLQIMFTEWLQAEVIYEIETDIKSSFSIIDEAMLEADFDPWGFKIGKQYIPFGEYYSHFVSGPLLEFAQTRANSLIVDYSINDHVELAGYFLMGNSRRVGDNGFYSDWDWGASIELVFANEAVRLNAGYLSDLSESDEGLLIDFGNNYQQRIPAWNVHALIGYNSFEVTAEVVRATRSFKEFDQNMDKPFAWNIELAWYPQDTLQYALRLELSDELEDEPRWQYGAAVTWQPFNNLSVTLEYIRSKYKKDFVQDDNDNSFNNRNSIAAQVSLEF